MSGPSHTHTHTHTHTQLHCRPCELFMNFSISCKNVTPTDFTREGFIVRYRLISIGPKPSQRNDCRRMTPSVQLIYTILCVSVPFIALRSGVSGVGMSGCLCQAASGSHVANGGDGGLKSFLLLLQFKTVSTVVKIIWHVWPLKNASNERKQPFVLS